MSDIGKLTSGFKIFKSTTFEQKKDIIHHLIDQGQKPTTMVITCCDLRLSPAEIFASNPGELYVINNIGGLVPHYETSDTHGILSAIEYATEVLEVQNIILLGHARCDGIKMMMSDKFTDTKHGLSQSMKTWLSVAEEARVAVKKELADKSEEYQQKACEEESLVISLRNLMEYPHISKRVKANKLSICGWHFDVKTGEILTFDANTGFFEPLI